MSDSDRDPADRPFSVRNARWRGWLRVHTPNFLYYRLGLVVPKARDCGNHEWHNKGDGTDACYHCEVTRLTPPDAPWFGNRFDPVDDDEAVPQARVLFRVSNRSPSALLVRIEPWAHEVELAAGATHEALLTGPDPADVEVRVATDEVTVYGWAGSVLDGAGLPVPPTPPRIR